MMFTKNSKWRTGMSFRRLSNSSEHVRMENNRVWKAPQADVWNLPDRSPGLPASPGISRSGRISRKIPGDSPGNPTDARKPKPDAPKTADCRFCYSLIPGCVSDVGRRSPSNITCSVVRCELNQPIRVGRIVTCCRYGNRCDQNDKE